MKPQWMWLLVGAAGATAVFLVVGGNIGSAVLLLLVLACPVGMLLMMRGMSGMHGTGQPDDTGAAARASARNDAPGSSDAGRTTRP